MTMLRWTGALVAVAALWGMAPTAEAQGVVIQGEVQVQTPQGYAQPPPGYGQGSATVYVQPQYPQQQPQYPQQQQQYYQPQYQPPPQRRLVYEEQEQDIRGLWVTGLITFGVSYLIPLSVGITALQEGWDEPYTNWLMVPVIGPWISLAETHGDPDLTAISTIVGVVQAAGLTMFILGLSLTRTVRVARYVLNEGDERSPELAFDLLPAPGGGQLGMTLTHF